MDEQQEGRLVKWLQKVNVSLTNLISGSVGGNTLSNLTPVLIESAEAPGAKTLAGLYTAFTTWTATNATKTVVSMTHVMGGDGIPGIIVLYK